MQPLYSLTGPVIHGLNNGAKFGFPTANLQFDSADALPPFGVYISAVILSGIEYWGVTNVGFRPTLSGEQSPTVETLILDFDGDLYGQTMTLQLYRFLRPTRKMASLTEVKRQIDLDALEARKFFTGQNHTQ